jgi:hypothetical protein
MPSHAERDEPPLSLPLSADDEESKGADDAEGAGMHCAGRAIIALGATNPDAAGTTRIADRAAIRLRRCAGEAIVTLVASNSRE